MKPASKRYVKVLGCVIAAIGVLLPPCTAKSLNSPIIFNYSTYGEILDPVVVPIPLARPTALASPWRRKEENPQKEINPPTTTSGHYPDVDNGSSEDEQQRPLSNSSCLAGISCDEFFSLAPPTDVIALVPPPPLPLFLFELELSQKRERGLANWELQAKKFNFRSYYVLQREDNDGDATIVFRINPQWLSESHIQECLLCDWAKNESTHPLFTATKSSQVAVSKVDNWNVAVMGVALISATIGACLTCILIKLKRIKRMKPTQQRKEKGIPQTQTSSEQSASIKNSIPNNFGRRTKRLSNELTDNKKQGEEESPHGHSPPPVSPQFADEISEELYINANAPSVTYSDVTLDNGQEVNDDPATVPSVSTTISDTSVSTFHMCDPLCQKTRRETCDKRGDILLESSYNLHHCSPCCSGSSPSGGSSSTPSSAYYSDVSICEVQPSRRKKKKRKVDLVLVKDRLGNFIKEPSSALNVQSAPLKVPFPSARGQFVTSCVQGITAYNFSDYMLPTPSCVHSAPPCSMQYIPRFMMLKPANLPKTNIAHFHCLPNIKPKPVLLRSCDGNMNFSSVKNIISVTSSEDLIIKGTDLDSTGVSLNNCNPDKCILGNFEQIKEVNQEALRNEGSVPHLCHQQTDAACKLDYEVYKEYSSSEVPSEYI